MRIIAVNHQNRNQRVDNNKKISGAKLHNNSEFNSLSNKLYKNNYIYNINFTRSWKEHKSWGAVINPETKDVSFKIPSYPDTKKVSVTVINQDTGEEKTFDLDKKENGVFQTQKPISSAQAKAGDSYYYNIYSSDGNIYKVSDPYSFMQKELTGSSVLYDHSNYIWHDSHWKTNSNRIKRTNNGVLNTRIYELNLATFSKERTYKGASDKLQKIKDLGFNAIEIMPVEYCNSYNWGYDGVKKLAPNGFYGSPDELKDLINHAHNVGLNVIMDLVPNHVGPDGNELKEAGPFLGSPSPWGDSFNYEGKNSRYVRDYMVNCALNWIDNYHCDGLRLDMTKFMGSDTELQQICAEVNYHKPEVFIIAEDSREKINVHGDVFWYDDEMLHDKRVINPLHPEDYGFGQNEQIHNQMIDEIANFNLPLARLGCDSEWDFKYFKQLKSMLFNSGNPEEYLRAVLDSQTRVKYFMSHDEIGNEDGTRLISKLIAHEINLINNINLTDSDRHRISQLKGLKGIDDDAAYLWVLGQKTQFVCEKLTEMLLTGALDKYKNDDRAFKQEVLKQFDINLNSNINYHKLVLAYKKSFDKNKVALASIYAIPGPKMVFQGDERSDITPFRFFRQFSTPEDLSVEKGYDAKQSALEKSTLGRIKYSPVAKRYMNSFRNLTVRLNQINEENPALTSGHIAGSYSFVHNKYKSNHVGYLLKTQDGKNQIYTVINFSDNSWPSKTNKKYNIILPKGTWELILNTDDKEFGGSGVYSNTEIQSDGYSQVGISIKSNSLLMFKKID